MSDSLLLIEKKRDTLKTEILALGERVHEALTRSREALRHGDLDLARTIIEDDLIINRERRALEQQALVILAAYRPAGRDLRLIGASLEMVAEMERIADYAADIARCLQRAASAPHPTDMRERIAAIGDQATSMFTQAMEAYANDADEIKARATAARDDVVDGLEQSLMQEILTWMQQRPNEARIGLALLAAAHDYERVADRATNIAELVVYIATGRTPDLD